MTRTLLLAALSLALLPPLALAAAVAPPPNLVGPPEGEVSLRYGPAFQAGGR